MMDRGDGEGPSVDPTGLFDMPALGATIAGKYRLDAIIGRGGMSVVYRATHLELDQLVALKILSANAIVLPEYVARLKREARAASRIRSEHVARIFDIGEIVAPDGKGGIPFLVMEHLHGSDLAALLLHRGPFSVQLAVECVLQACEPLAEAHALGIVHRDLKPANLFLTESVDGSPCIKVLDFGISRMVKKAALSPLTDPGIVLGTPSYMAPEQMEGEKEIDARADIWALGSILYELLLGRPPYTGDSLPRILMKIVRGKMPRPSARRKGLPPEIDGIVARCLALEPDDRFASVAELAWALSELGTERTRDSAARISRVFDRRSAESGGVAIDRDRTLVFDDVHTTLRARRWTKKRIALASACALLGGIVVGFGVEGARAPVANAAAPVVMPIVPTVVEGESPSALSFAPAVRPAPVEPPAVAPPPPAPPPPPRVAAAVDSGVPPPDPEIAAAKNIEREEDTERDPSEGRSE